MRSAKPCFDCFLNRFIIINIPLKTWKLNFNIHVALVEDMVKHKNKDRA